MTHHTTFGAGVHSDNRRIRPLSVILIIVLCFVTLLSPLGGPRRAAAQTPRFLTGWSGGTLLEVRRRLREVRRDGGAACGGSGEVE